MEGKSQICLIAAFDPTKRLTVEESLAQPFLAEYYDPADEPTAEKPFQYEVINKHPGLFSEFWFNF